MGDHLSLGRAHAKIVSMLTYKAMYKYVPEGVHAEVLDFPGAITFGSDLEDARQRLASALVDMAETNLLANEPLPAPDPTRTDTESDIEEPIHLLLSASSRVAVTPAKPAMSHTA
jgi:predicted RNase H-like HicB family nuclease